MFQTLQKKAAVTALAVIAATLLPAATIATAQNPAKDQLEALSKGAEIIAQGVVVSVGPPRERSLLTNPNPPPRAPRAMIQEADVTIQVKEVFKGKLEKDTSVALVIRIPAEVRPLPGEVRPPRRAIAPGQRFIMFLKPPNPTSPAITAAPVLAGFRRFEVFGVATGFDTVAMGFLEIVDDRIRLVPNQTIGGMAMRDEGMARFESMPMETFLNELQTRLQATTKN
jgi:hypothetical protein